MMVMGLKQAIALYILATASFQVPTAHAAIYHVATSGSDANPGTVKQPWRTVAHAAATMEAGDTTYVQGGTYNEGIIEFSKSGTQSAPIKLLNAAGESPLIQFIDKSKLHRILLQNKAGFRHPIGWITIEGFQIQNGYNGIKMYNGHDLTIRRNWIHGSLSQGILGNGTRILIDRNTINHNGGFDECMVYKPRCTLDHGIYMNGTAITITNNLIYDNLAMGIQLNASSSSSYKPDFHPKPEFALSENWIIANNTIAYENNGPAIVVWGSTCNNARIENNIFYENSVNGSSYTTNGVAFTSTTCTGITIRNNLLYASREGGTAAFGLRGIEGVHYTQSGNMINVNDPRFINAPAALPASPNFALTEQSPAIDAGLPITMTKIAFDGTPRPQGRAYDIGAYEYSADSDIKGPTAPTALQIR
jgi:hypothetical protein